jgi:hypothetical protein
MVILKNMRKYLTVIIAFVAVGAFDYFTGYEVSSYPIYLIPIFLAFFNLGATAGYVACAIAVGMWATFDILDGHQLGYIRFWNGACRLLIYALFVYGLSVYYRTIAAHRKRLAAVYRLLPMCHGCGKILWKDGTWKSPKEALDLTVDAPLECPLCSEIKHESHSTT